MNWRQRRAARLRAKADRLDPDGMTMPLLFSGAQYHATWEDCCQVHYFNSTGIGAPLYYLARDKHRLLNETTAETADHDGKGYPVPHE